jgi:hypothetical protein
MTAPATAPRGYLYGVTTAGHVPEPMPAGVAGGRVRLLRHDGLAAVLSDYGGGSLAELPRESLLRCLLDHQRVLERLVEVGDVLPLEFGSLVASDGQALEILAQCRDLAAAQLQALAGCVEVEVAASWDLERELRELTGDQGIAGAREEIAARGTPGLDDRVRLGRLVKRELDRLRRGFQDRLIDAVKPVAVHVAPNALVSDVMVANVAVLVGRDRTAELEERVEELDRALEPRLRFRVIGPMPPYTFSTLVVRRLDRAEVEAARSLLGVTRLVDETAVRAAFRARAAGVGRLPDRAARIAALRAARDLVLASDGAPGDRWVLLIRRPPAGDDVEAARFGAG